MFYVYLYRDPRPTKGRQPVYVGKGSKRRAWMHWKHGNTGNKPFNDWLVHIRRKELVPIIEIVAEFQNEGDAHLKECELIVQYGRRDLKTGSLFNSTNGGLGVAGKVWTPEYRLRLVEAARNRDKGPFRTPEFRAKIGAISSANWQDLEYRERTTQAMTAAQNTDEARARKSAATVRGWRDPKSRAKRIAAISASRTPELRAQIGASCKALWGAEKRLEQSAKMKAVLASAAAKAQRSAAMRARWADSAQREKLRAALSKPHRKK